MTINARPATVDLNIYAGDGIAVRINVTTAGTPADLTGATAAAQIRARRTDPDPLATFTTATDPAGGTVTLSLDGPTTATLPPHALWDCQLDWDGAVTTIAAGVIRTAGEVTR